MNELGNVGTCDYCHRRIRFVPTRKGKRMPLDAEPSPEGTVVIEFEGPGETRPVARVLSRGEVAAGPTYVSHFATCSFMRKYHPDNLTRARDRKLEEHGLGGTEDSRRRCSFGDCVELIERSHLVCRSHWRMVPANIQSALLRYSDRRQVWDEPRPGEVRPSLACRNAAAAALEAIAAAGAPAPGSRP